MLLLREAIWQMLLVKNILLGLPADQRALREDAGGRELLHSSLHGGDGGHLWAVAGGGEEEDQLSEGSLPLHPQSSGHHQQWEVTRHRRVCFSLGGCLWFTLCLLPSIPVCLCVSVKAVYSELHDTLMAINDQDDLKWWKNNHGPGMPTDWPKIQVVHVIIRGIMTITHNICELWPAI